MRVDGIEVSIDMWMGIWVHWDYWGGGKTADVHKGVEMAWHPNLQQSGACGGWSESPLLESGSGGPKRCRWSWESPKQRHRGMAFRHGLWGRVGHFG